MTKCFTSISQTIGGAIVAALLATAPIGAASADMSHRIFDFTIKNMTDRYWEFTVVPGECYEGENWQEGPITIKLGAYEDHVWKVARVQGHGCDGKAGWFAIKIEHQKDAVFGFDNAKTLWEDRSAGYNTHGCLQEGETPRSEYIWEWHNGRNGRGQAAMLSPCPKQK